MAICGAGSHLRVVVVVTTRRARCTSRGAARRAILRLAGPPCFTLTGLVLWISPWEGASETCTAPPPSIAPPAAAAANFANAIRTDMIFALVLPWEGASTDRLTSCLPFLTDQTTQMVSNRAMGLTLFRPWILTEIGTGTVRAASLYQYGTDRRAER